MTKRHLINPPLNIYKKIALSFIILTLVLIAIVFYFTLSYAYITVYPKQQTVQTDFKFYIAEDDAVINPSDGIFKGTIVNQTLEGIKTFATTGTKTLPSDIVGKVKIINNLSREQILIPKTRLLTADNILFRLTDRVTIPARNNVIADVYADDPSKPMVKAGTKFTIPGLNANLQGLIYATAENDFKADGQTISAVSAEELDKAAAEYAEELGQQIFKAEDQNKAKILTKEVIEKSFSNKAGDEVSNFTLKLKLKVVGVIFEEQQVKDFARKILEQTLPEDQELSSVNDQLIYEIEKYDLDNKLAQIKSNINGISILSGNSPILDTDKLVKLNLSEIKAYLENFDTIEKVDINFFPYWLRKVPYFQDHIIIRVKK
jgi:hypothetical protein